MKIFVIDDEHFMRESLKAFINQNYPLDEVTVFDNGAEALGQLYTRPDLVILDYHLNLDNHEAENGIEILKKITTAFPSMPVIFLSAQEDPRVAADSIKYGAYDYVVKNENAHNRLQLLFKKIHSYNQLNSKSGWHQTLNIVLTVLVAGLILGIIVMRIMGM